MKLLFTTFFQASALLAALLPPPIASAADGPPHTPVVQVNALSNPDQRSYAAIIKGMDLFEKLHGKMAPDAALRFELQPSRAKTIMKNVQLRIAGRDGSVPVALADDMTFTVPRLPAMLAERATVSSNRRDDSLLWRARIRTPGLPPNTRRLGDLRLEWHVDYVAELGPRWIAPGSKLVMAMMERPYEMRGLHHLFLADRPLFGVTMVSGERRQVISADLLYLSNISQALPSIFLALWKDRNFIKDRAYDLPLHDASWPDDTLVVIEYMDDVAPLADKP